MKFRLSDLLRRKQEFRDRQAAKPVAEKLRILERLRDRDRMIRNARNVPTTACDDRTSGTTFVRVSTRPPTIAES